MLQIPTTGKREVCKSIKNSLKMEIRKKDKNDSDGTMMQRRPTKNKKKKTTTSKERI